MQLALTKDYKRNGQFTHLDATVNLRNAESLAADLRIDLSGSRVVVEDGQVGTAMKRKMVQQKQYLVTDILASSIKRIADGGGGTASGDETFCSL